MARLYTANFAIAAIALFAFAFTGATRVSAQPVTLKTAARFGVLAGSTVTNTGSTVINGEVGLSPGTAVTGFPPGTATAIHVADAVALQAQIDLTVAYLDVLSRPTTVGLTGQNLGGLTLAPGVYNFNSSAQLTGSLTLDGLGNPNARFIFNIGSTLTTASSSSVLLINGALGNNVYFRVGSSATLGTNTSFAGEILALTSITLNTGATINCGAALARNGAVTLDNNKISICTTPPTAIGPGTTGTGPDTVLDVPVATVLPPSANNGQRGVASVIDAFVANGGTLPSAFENLVFFLSPTALADAFTQLEGDAGTGSAPAGIQAMNSFMSLMTNPFGNNRPFTPFAEERPQTRPPMYVKAPVYYKAPVGVAPDPRRWGVWGAAYGGQNTTTGDSVAGSHDRSARALGFATGLDYLFTPYTVVGIAVAGGSTNFSLADGFGSGHSDMFQAAVYSTTRINAAYVSAVLAYAWHDVSTDRYLTLAGTDHLTADFTANNFGGRIEGGYRIAVPGVFDAPGFGLTPYAALQVQAFRTPSYSETAASGSSDFALAYDANTTTATRTELGSWVDTRYALDRDSALSLFGRAAWAHDWYSDMSVTATFLALPGSSFIETGAPPARDLALLTAGAELYMRNGWSAMAKLDGELAQHSHTYIVSARLRYTW